MRSNYKKLGKYIQQVDVRNKDLEVETLLGVSVSKSYMPSIANTVGTDFSKYKIVKRNQFTYIPDTSRRGDKIGIALLEDYEKALVSQAYTVFEIIDTEKLDPAYLMMWFRRPEFDRYARFKSHGSVREIFDWEEMCNVELPLPSIDKQREIVKEYNTIKNRIALNEQLIQKLEETAQAIYKQWFVDFEFPNENGKPYKSSGGKMVWNEELDKEIPVGWTNSALKKICSKIGSGATPKGGKESYQDQGISLIRSTNVHDYHFSIEDLAFIDDKQADGLKNVIVSSKDVLFNITGVSVARCTIVPDYILPARVNQHVMIIRPKKPINYYLHLLLCHTESKSKLLGISQSGSTREAITKADIEEFQILLPTKSVNEEFEVIAEKTFTTIQIIRKENNTLNSFLELLHSKLATIENLA